jgi:hypothetical protein
MKKNSKLIIAILGIVMGICLIGGTIYCAKQNNSNVSNLNSGMMGRPDISNSSSNSSTGQTPPDMNSGSMQKPDQSNDNSTSSSDSTNSNSTTNDNSTNSSSTNDASSNSANNNMGPRMNRGNDSNSSAPSMPNNISNNSNTLNNWQILLIGCGSLLISLAIVYLIMSKAGVNKIFTSLDQIIIFVLINIIVTWALSFGTVMLTNKYVLNSSSTPQISTTDTTATATSITA